MAKPHSTETKSQDFQIFALEQVRVEICPDLELYQPCLVTVQFRRDGKGLRVRSKPVHTVPGSKSEALS